MTRSPQILIITIAGDVHAYAVAEALQAKGAEVVLWHTSDFPSRATEGLLFGGDEPRGSIRGPGLRVEAEELSAVWNRRTELVLDEGCLHEADRKFAELECRTFRRSFLSLLAPRAFWVNPHAAAARTEHKPVQHRHALEVGLRTPETLYSNDPELIRGFIDRHGGEVVYKGFLPAPWSDGERVWMPYTSRVRQEDLPADPLLRATPGIFQKVVPKDHELRVTVIGRRAFTVKLLSQQTATGRLDWRKSYAELSMEPQELDPATAGLCRALMERLGLAFGCFDFVVTPDGDHVFLEVNQMGQFLFLEAHAGLPLTDAFTELLLQARMDYAWNEERAEIFFTHAKGDELRETAEAFREEHVEPPPLLWSEP